MVIEESNRDLTLPGMFLSFSSEPSSEYYTDDRPSYICSICNQTLIRLTDAGMNNVSFWCRNCSVEFNPEEENVRRESKLSVPDRNIEPAISTTPGIPDISIRHEPEIKGGLKALKDKGIKITITKRLFLNLREDKDDFLYVTII